LECIRGEGEDLSSVDEEERREEQYLLDYEITSTSMHKLDNMNSFALGVSSSILPGEVIIEKRALSRVELGKPSNPM
jgi:hypothetical protein